jgi:predicted NAD-dependent protein-ADP-ribosyltransferase YbiA (DUF1768 family)
VSLVSATESLDMTSPAGKDMVSTRDPKQWKGTNLLGFALMEVRDILSSL